MSVFEIWPLNATMRIRGGLCNPQCDCLFYPLIVAGPIGFLLSHPENISISKYSILKIYLIYRPGILLEKLACYLHWDRLHCWKVLCVRRDTVIVSACDKMSSFNSLTFGSKCNIPPRKINTLSHLKTPVTQSFQTLIPKADFKVSTSMSWWIDGEQRADSSVMWNIKHKSMVYKPIWREDLHM